MKFFIDTAEVTEIRAAYDLGLVDGVTTNPSLIAKSGRDFKEVIKEITDIVDGPISAEVISLDAEGMLKEGRELVKIHKNIVNRLFWPLKLEQPMFHLLLAVLMISVTKGWKGLSRSEQFLITTVTPLRLLLLQYDHQCMFSMPV